MRLFRLALNQIRREWQSSELLILFFALVVAVAAVSSVNFFTDRIQNALHLQANSLLGADLILSSSQKIDPEIALKAKELNLETVNQVTFPSMVTSNDEAQLVWLKVVEKGFPLRGKLGISPRPFAKETMVQHSVPKGEVWLEPRLFAGLAINVNDNIQIGALKFKVGAVLISEPGRGGDLFNIAPRVLLNYQDLAATELIQPGSRVRYSLLVAGETTQVSEFRQYVKNMNNVNLQIQGIEDARPEIRTALSRAEQFLGLAALTSVILAGVAIALAARRFAQSHLDHCAIMRCIGATQRMIFGIYAWQLIILGVVASALGVLFGYLFHEILIELLGSFVGVNLPAAGITPVLFGMATGLITLIGFALPPIIALKKVPALRVLKRDLGDFKAPQVFSYLVGILALSVLMILQARDIKLGIFMVAGALVAGAILAMVSFALLLLLKHFKHQFNRPWLFGLRNLLRRPATTVVQVVAFGLGIMALLILTLIRGDLLDEWQASVPDDAPNRFVINIRPDQVDAMKHFFIVKNEVVPSFYPMIRGRLVEINGTVITADSFSDQRAKQLLSREFNLSWTQSLPQGNGLSSGEWWTDNQSDEPLISLETSVAENLNLSIGDKLLFKVADQTFEGKVFNVRKVDWNSFNANFYVLTTQGLLSGFPSTYMTPFYLASEKFELLNAMVAEFSNVTVIDVAAIMNHVREIIHRVTMAVEYVFIFTLLSGLMVLLAGIQSTYDDRLLENAIIRTVGGSRKQIMRTLIVEFTSLGVLSGAVAAILATIIAAVLAKYVLQTSIHVNLEIVFYGLIAGGVGVGVIGVMGSRSVLSQPPLVILKKLR